MLADNVEEDRISVDGNKLERITKDNGKIKRQRSKDGVSQQETRLVLKADVDAAR